MRPRTRNALKCAKRNNEAGQYPNQNNLNKYISFYRCSKDWLLTGQGPVYQNTDDSNEAVGIVAGPASEYHTDKDDFGRAVSGLKEIFDSGDPVLVPTAKAGIHAFQISVRRETQINEQARKINRLEEECNDLKLRISTLENRLMEGDRRKQVRRQEDLGPPGGMVERRSGLDRRKIIKTPLNTQGQMLENRK